MDDFSLELLATMPEAQRLKAAGATYDNAFVVDSLCCPSRASIFTGQAPHQTGVLTNTPNDYGQPIGGFEAFVQYGNLEKSFNVALQASGYTTGFIGKYMNRYEATTANGVTQPPPKVPGWTDWEAILGGGYNGWGYKSTRLDEAGNVVLDNHPKPAITDPAIDEEYATNVAADKAIDFIQQASRPGRAVLPGGRGLRPAQPARRGVPGPAAVPLGHGRPSAGRTADRRQLRAEGVRRPDAGRPGRVRRPARRQRAHLPERRRHHEPGSRLAHERDPAHRRAGADPLPRPRADGAVDRPDDRPASARRSARTPTWC